MCRESVFGEPHQVHGCEAEVGDEDVRTADFLFIDPLDKSHWPTIQSVLRAGKSASQSALVWLPSRPMTARNLRTRRQSSAAKTPRLRDATSCACTGTHQAPTPWGACSPIDCHLPGGTPSVLRFGKWSRSSAGVFSRMAPECSPSVYQRSARQLGCVIACRKTSAVPRKMQVR